MRNVMTNVQGTKGVGAGVLIFSSLFVSDDRQFAAKVIGIDEKSSLNHNARVLAAVRVSRIPVCLRLIFPVLPKNNYCALQKEADRSNLVRSCIRRLLVPQSLQVTSGTERTTSA